MAKKSNIIEVMKFAGTYVSVCIGSGFATGQEIMQFFSAYGLISIVSNILCMIILAYCGASLLDIGKTARLKSSNDIFSYLCGDIIGNVFRIFMPLFFLSSFIVMIAGAGAAMSQYYGISRHLGSLILVVLSFLSVVLGMSKIIDILGNIGPIIIVVSIFIGIITVTRNMETLLQANEIITQLNITKALPNWWMSPLVYSGLNIIIVTPFLAGVGKTSSSRRNCILGGALGGILFILAAMVINLGLLSVIKDTYLKEIPTLFMADNISKVIGIMFSLILIAGIYTTAVPLLYSVCDNFAREKTMKFNLIAFACCIIGIIGGSLPFADLVNFIYPISGVLGVIIIFGIVIKQLILYKNRIL